MSGSKNEQTTWSTTARNGPPKPAKHGKKAKNKTSKKNKKSKSPKPRSSDIAGIGSQFTAYDSSDPKQRPSTMADSDFY